MWFRYTCDVLGEGVQIHGKAEGLILLISASKEVSSWGCLGVKILSKDWDGTKDDPEHVGVNFLRYLGGKVLGGPGGGGGGQVGQSIEGGLVGES